MNAQISVVPTGDRSFLAQQKSRSILGRVLTKNDHLMEKSEMSAFLLEPDSLLNSLRADGSFAEPDASHEQFYNYNCNSSAVGNTSPSSVMLTGEQIFQEAMKFVQEQSESNDLTWDESPGQ